MGDGGWGMRDGVERKPSGCSARIEWPPEGSPFPVSRFPFPVSRFPFPVSRRPSRLGFALPASRSAFDLARQVIPDLHIELGIRGATPNERPLAAADRSWRLPFFLTNCFPASAAPGAKRRQRPQRSWFRLFADQSRGPLIAIRRVVVGVFVRRGAGERGERRRRHQRSREVDEHGTQMATVPEQRHRSAPSCEQKRNRRHVALRGVAFRTRQHEVVATVVRRLAAPRRDMVERHLRRLELTLAVGTDRPVLGEKPPASLRIGRPVGGVRREPSGGGVGPVGTCLPRTATASRATRFCLRLCLGLRLRRRRVFPRRLLRGCAGC